MMFDKNIVLFSWFSWQLIAQYFLKVYIESLLEGAFWKMYMYLRYFPKFVYAWASHWPTLFVGCWASASLAEACWFCKQGAHAKLEVHEDSLKELYKLGRRAGGDGGWEWEIRERVKHLHISLLKFSSCHYITKYTHSVCMCVHICVYFF